MRLSNLSRYWKTVVSAATTAIAFITALITDPAISNAVTDDRITGGEWRGIGLLLMSTVLVYAVPNKAPAGELPRRDLSEQG